MPLPRNNPEEAKAWLEKAKKKLRAFISKPGVKGAVVGMLRTILGKDFSKYTFNFSDDLQPRTDGHYVYISLLPDAMDDQYMKYWGVLLRTAGVHEIFHLLCSNFKDMEEIREWGAKKFEEYGLDGRIGAYVSGDMLNILEDGRIETIAVSWYPTTFAGFYKMNQLIRFGCELQETGDDEDEAMRQYKNFIGQILSYAKTGQDAPEWETFKTPEMETNFTAIRSYIDDACLSDTSQGCRDNTEALIEEIMPYVAKLIKLSEDLQDQLQNSQSQDEYTGSGSGVGHNPNSQGGRSLRGGPPQAGNGQGEDGEGDDEDDGSREGAEAGQVGAGSAGGHLSREASGTTTNNSDSEESASGMMEKELEEMEKAFEKAAENEAAKEQHDAAIPAKDGLSDEEINKLLSQEYGGIGSGFVEKWVKLADRQLPQAMKAQADFLRRQIEKFFTVKNQTMRRQKTGKVDVRGLYRVGLKKEDIFYKKGDPNAASCACYLLLDNSGSMDGYVAGDRERKFAEARIAAAIIEEAFKGLIPTKIALFHCCGRSVHTSLKSFDSKEKQNVCYSSISEIGPTGCNEDSVHINYAVAELKKRPEKRKILLVLSDGTPSAYGSRESGWVEVKRAVDKARKAGIEVIAIMFGDEGFFEYEANNYKQMYSKNIIACDPRDITKRLPEVLKTVITGK